DGTTELTWNVQLPEAWTFVRHVVPIAPALAPSAGDQGTIRWIWTQPSPGVFSFAYTLLVSAEERGTQTISALVNATSGSTPLEVLITPSPLAVPESDRELWHWKPSRVIPLGA